MHDAALRGVHDAVRSLGAKKLGLDRFAALLVRTATHLQEQNGGLLRAVLVESLSDPTFPERARQQVRATGAAFAPVIRAPGVSLARRAEAIESAMLAVMAVLDQELFYGESLLGSQRSGKSARKQRHARLERIALAAINLEPRPTSPRARAKG